MFSIVTFFVLRAVQNSWGRDPDHVGSYSCVKKLTGVARLLLNRVGEVIRQLVTELARLHLAHLHLHLAWNVVTLLGGGSSCNRHFPYHPVEGQSSPRGSATKF